METTTADATTAKRNRVPPACRRRLHTHKAKVYDKTMIYRNTCLRTGQSRENGDFPSVFADLSHSSGMMAGRTV